MKLTVLGSCGAWLEPGRACSGFLVEHAGVRVAVDLGYGVLPRLLSALGSTTADGLDAVVITHRHPDHAIDLHGLFRARWFGRRGAPRLPVYAGEGVRETIRGLEETDEADDVVDRVFAWHPLPGPAYDLGGLALESVALPHFVPDAGVRLSADGVAVAYTGDTGPCEELVDLARDTDLYVAEASDVAQQDHLTATPERSACLSTSAQAGEAARRAGARRLMLTHFWPGNDREVSRRTAEASYGGPVLLADERLVVDLG